MSIVKSFAVGDGDMFYIDHNSDNFTIIDVRLCDDTTKRRIVDDEIKPKWDGKGIGRFISTHPDQDHLHGLIYLDDELKIRNFYCIKNKAIKKDETDDFKRYCELRDDTEKAFYIYKGCSRKWMNQSSDERGTSGINILWPDTSNEHFQSALRYAEEGGKSPNNTSAIIKYSIEESATFIWMGDLETEFMEKILDEVDLPKTTILFAPHHGRRSGSVPKEWLERMNPEIVVLGEAPAEYLAYETYEDYNTITQLSAGDITFDCESRKVHIYASKENYSVDFLDDEGKSDYDYYIGTLNLS